MNNKLTAHFRDVTQRYLGGATPMAKAELRLASIKGAFPFWWRALMWRRGVNTVADLHEKEAAVFGSSEKGQSRLLLSVEIENQPKTISLSSVLNAKGTGVSRECDTVGDGAR